MKKLLMIAATTVAMSSAAVADTADTFYGKIHGGAIFVNKAKDSATGLKMKSKATGFAGAGVGYNVMDNARVDLTLEGVFNPQMKKSGTVNGTAESVKHKATIMALMVNGYVDLFDMSVAKIFAGAGIGLAQVKEKISFVNKLASSKKINNFAYHLTLGATAPVAEGINAELAYVWKDFGKTKSRKDATIYSGAELSKTAYRGHNVGVAVRFDF